VSLHSSGPLPYAVIDVFTDRAFLGNPVAVVLEAGRLDDAAMMRIARWTNLSETTFVLPATDAGADYRLRIFTPERELPFAGHPTLGTAKALLSVGRIRPRDGRLVQQCAAGRVALRVDATDARLFFEVPAAKRAVLAADDRLAIAQALGLGDAQPPAFEAIDLGPVWLTAELSDAAAVLALRPDMAALESISRRLRATGVTVYGRHSGDAQGQIEVRSLAPAAGVAEDPVCGSGNACVAVQRAAHGLRDSYVARQGRCVGRDGFVSVEYSADRIEVGGMAVVCVEGHLRLP
jgi:PhzF family phenazine biosynthesis protein